MKTLLLTSGLTLALATAAMAQSHNVPDDASNGGAGARTGHITSTGETVPNPGASQSGGTTAMDKGIQNQDNKIESGICKGC